MSSHTRRSRNPSSSPAGPPSPSASGGADRSSISPASMARSACVAPPAAAASRIASASSRMSGGSRSDPSHTSRANDTLTSAAASAALTRGCTASRRIQPMAPAAAPPVTRVCHRSHDLAVACPSASNPPPALNAASTRAWAATCAASARANARRHPASASAGQSATSAPARNARLASRPARAWATLWSRAPGCSSGPLTPATSLTRPPPAVLGTARPATAARESSSRWEAPFS